MSQALVILFFCALPPAQAAKSPADFDPRALCPGETFVKHPNGGGQVSVLAQVSSDAKISQDSLICGAVVISGPVEIRFRTLVKGDEIEISGSSKIHESTILNQASINNSSLTQNTVERATILGSMIYSSDTRGGTIEFSRVYSSRISDSINQTPHIWMSVVEDSEVKGGARVRSAHLRESLVRDQGQVKNSGLFNTTLEGNATVTNGSDVFNSTIGGDSSIDNERLNKKETTNYQTIQSKLSKLSLIQDWLIAIFSSKPQEAIVHR